MWEALLTILSTLCVQKSTGQAAAQGGVLGGFLLRFFYALEKYPYKSMTLYTVGFLANNLIHIICAELGRRRSMATFGGRNWWKDNA